MKKLTLFVALVAAIGCSKKTSADRSRPLLLSMYALDAVPTLELEISAEAVAQLREKPRKYVSGTIRHGSERFDNVAVRLKGHRSFRPLGKKAAFKLRFDKFDSKGRFLGARTLILNNMVEDPTKVREFLGYRLYRQAGVAAPRVGYANLILNGEAYGLYAVIEAPDEDLLVDRFGNSDGELYEGEYGCDLYVEDVEGLDRDHGKDKKRIHLRALAEAVASGSDVFYGPDAPINRESFLAYLAVSAFIGDFDGYRHAHNYRVYRDPKTNQWSFLPWGIDRAFKKAQDIYDSEGLLATKCFTDSRCRLDFLKTMRKVIEQFEKLDFTQGVAVITTVIDESLKADSKAPRRSVSKARAELLRYIRDRPAQIRKQLACLDGDNEVDLDGDGFGCMDCNDNDAAIHPEAVESCDGIDNNCSGLIDDSPTCGCKVVELDERQFHLCALPMPWFEARDYCSAMGLELATVEGTALTKLLRTATNAIDKERWWIGLSDRGSEGAFVWVSGDRVSDGAWAKGEPDNATCNQDCVVLAEGKSGRWHDTHCGQHRAFVCGAVQK